MRPLFFLISFLYLSFASAQNTNQGIDPPGTVQLKEDLFIDKTPITNQMFLEYLEMKDYLKSQGYESWKKYYSDKNETDWKRQPFTLYPSFLRTLEGEGSYLSKKGYFWDYRYTETPVLRVIKAQAEDFCQWRTEMVEYAWKYFPQYEDQKEFAEKIQYRLPSAAELQTAQQYFSEKDQLVRIKKRNPLRYKPSAEPEKFTLYNISEFTASSSLYGENWKEVTPAEFPNDFTGFRCVCEVRK